MTIDDVIELYADNFGNDKELIKITWKLYFDNATDKDIKERYKTLLKRLERFNLITPEIELAIMPYIFGESNE